MEILKKRPCAVEKNIQIYECFIFCLKFFSLFIRESIPTALFFYSFQKSHSI
ncbi:hypothetical protein LEP1GSC103_1763 [Leptospira borgpetersenii serovar Javanica str. UI 09931]|uniref:Uncharacterized protein n=5 Tax=Leptospira borgpetersenii TaxID=174 RepID=M3HM66_LEPBO|nr:hypothetical protein LBBP_01414 [Leptospira borgpetersenii serovar Ballum]EKP12214.1 hypothetical protein LEP1GSC128_0106 [Leptospira borgpetersenii str. 200801926]EKQ90809.1 hypothetical protein LEP1GSC101_1348 [Leptospira borgpetersenii str. UI 09149]EKR00651.1 hypothetical protein LEP1GSC121_1345 [Leptospira borgpetersenii serovar Castellonis str. 200801910]EMF99165.1 hypothetical protein LEP1GSC123_3350 [Leptospira borgpetersenii str. 200701203]EMK09579.1 hypothetical protein LEP1GSC066